MWVLKVQKCMHMYDAKSLFSENSTFMHYHGYIIQDNNKNKRNHLHNNTVQNTIIQDNNKNKGEHTNGVSKQH